MAIEVPPCVSHVGSTPAPALGVIARSASPTAADADGGNVAQASPRRKLTAAPQLRTLPLFISLPPTFVKIIDPSLPPFLGRLKISPHLHGSSPLIHQNTPQA